MLKKSLLMSVTLISLNSIQAAQTTQPHHTQNPAHQDPVQHEQKPAVHHDQAHPAKDTNQCPCGGVSGWVLLPVGQAGAPCNQGKTEEKKEEETTHHEAPEHHVVPHKPTAKPSLHPLPTPEEEALEVKLKPIQAHIFNRTDPNHPNAEKKGEWGKALNGKVYFRVLGIWKHDPSVNATTDIVATGVKDRIKMLNEQGKKQQQPQKPTPTAGKQAAKSWPKVNVPDALGTTQGRVQSANTNPTKGNELELGLGAPNRAQTGITGKPIPEADTSGTKPAVAPPSNIKAELAE